MLFAAEQQTLTPKDKAFYLSEKEQSFIRPGLDFQITSATAAADGTVQYTFTVKDPRGLPLDRLGVTTPGPIAVTSVLARIPAGQTVYQAYTTRNVTSTITGQSAVQATSDVGGAFTKLGDGEYRYTFATKLPADADRSVTHTVAAYVSRNLSEFELANNNTSDTFDFVPDSSKAPDVTLSVTDAKCNACHGDLTVHGIRKGVALCVTCHNPGSTDPDTGNTVDMATMVHKIHMGKNLPSVAAGQPYQIIGFRNTVHDYSKVVFPANVRNCQACHVEDVASLPAPLTASLSPMRSRSREEVVQANLSAAAVAQTGAPDANRHFLNPNRRACGACHDSVNFATGANHAGLPQVSDNQCNRCHNPVGELEFDLSIKGAHTIPSESRELPGVVFDILSVSDGAPGRKPTVTFSVKNAKGEPVAASSIERMALVLAARNGGDYSRIFSENPSSAQGSGGVYTYTFQNATIPDDAMGTWAVGIEGFRTETLLRGTERERKARDAGKNKVFYFDVNGGTPEARRTVVGTENCEACHATGFSFHTSRRNKVEHCVLCHNPNATDAGRRSADQQPGESLNFKQLMHRIHAGARQIRDFTTMAGSPHNFNGIVFPRSLADCAACHVNGTENLPLRADLLPAVDPRGPIDPAPPATGACLACHTSLSAAAHADLNISEAYGESCDVCHGANAQFSVSRSHAR